MRLEIVGQVPGAHLRAELDPGEFLFAHPAGLLTMDEALERHDRSPGRLRQAVGRVLGGAAPFRSGFEAVRGGGTVRLAPARDSEIAELAPGLEGAFTLADRFLAAGPGVTVEWWRPARGPLSLSPMVRAFGMGKIYVSGSGRFVTVALAPGEALLVDRRRIVGFTEGVLWEGRRAARRNKPEALPVPVRATGPGTLYLQSRMADPPVRDVEPA